MATYHFNVKLISRGKSDSITCRASYITGQNLYDYYYGKEYYRYRQDVLFQSVVLPDFVPNGIYDLQHLCDAIDAAEKRYDSRTGREFIGSLPNELSLDEQVQIVNKFIDRNFIVKGLCAIAAIHERRNDTDPSKNNPHAHIIIPTRTLTADGFSAIKYRELDSKSLLLDWRKSWADVQNRAYERAGLNIRVSHESLEVQGIYDRIPTPHLSQPDYQREQRGERTFAGDRKRKIEEHNRAVEREKVQSRERTLTRSR